jgi:hypothetical protein
MGNVGNGYPQFPATIAALLTIHRIIEVPGILAIYGDKSQFVPTWT